jgi:NAD(P)H-dependent flavin oxidoreductase YrpB (nitropropane dioxygenase family)
MLRTRFTDLLGVEHPIALAGMGGGATSGELDSPGADDGLIYFGQSAGLIDSIKPAAEIVRELVAEAEEILRSLPTSP